MAKLTFEKPYTIPQLANLIHSSYREVYDFFRTKRSRELFTVARPWVEVLEEADPKLSKGKRTHYKKWVQNPDVLVRLCAKGFDLITARANLKPEICTGSEPENRQQERRQRRQSEKQLFRKLNYPQLVLNALAAGELDPSDLPTSCSPGSAKYLALVPDKEDRILQEELSREEIVDPENISENGNGTPLPSGWTLASMMQNYSETDTLAHGGAFGAEGIPDEGEPLDLPYSMDRMFDLFNQDMYKKLDPYKLGKCSPERYAAAMKLIKANIKNFGYTIDLKDENGKRKFIPHNSELFEECVELFQDYLERTSGESLVLMPKKDPWGVPILKPNANRFNNEEKRIEARIRFENIFNDASRKYKSAVMLTLTSGQWHRNIFEDTKMFQENFNKLITRLRKEAKDKRLNELVKRNPEFLKVRLYKNLVNIPEEEGREESDYTRFNRVRNEQKIHNGTASVFRKAAFDYAKADNNLKLPYLCVREFQRNGNVHYHVVIFGMNWLKHNNEISRIWQEYGQGKITKINKIRWNEERGYIWEKAPEDAKGRQPLEYLKKYLLKGQYAEKNPEASLLYWVFNSRFFTYSSSLLSDEHRPRPYISKGLYEFFGVCCNEYWMDNGDSLICVVDSAG